MSPTRELVANMIKAVRQDRTVRVMVLAALLVIGMGVLRPDEITGVYSEVFWVEKTRWARCADVVIAGDSRVGVGVSCAAMTEYLPGLRIYNYGFNANGYSADYLTAVDRVLDPASARRIIVLGITPRSLGESSGAQNFFTEYRKASSADLMLSRCFGPMLRFVEPMSFSDAWRGLIGDRKHTRQIRRYHRCGWIASAQLPERIDQKLDNYRAEFQENPVSDQVVAQLIEAVRRWGKAGLSVFAFRPPTTAAMVELEDMYSGFNQQQFTEAFEAAGGVWIRLDQTGYRSYDGSHLRQDAAEALSRRLGLAIGRSGRPMSR